MTELFSVGTLALCAALRARDLFFLRIRPCFPSCCHFLASSQPMLPAPQTAAQLPAPSLGSSAHPFVPLRKIPSPCFQTRKRRQRERRVSSTLEMLVSRHCSDKLPLLPPPPHPSSFLASGDSSTKTKLGQLVYPSCPSLQR